MNEPNESDGPSPPSEDTRSKDGPADRRPTPGPRHVLIVDDMATIRLVLSRYVKELGHIPTQAADGRAALDLLHAHPFDLVLLDLMMPRMDGFAALEEIKQDPLLQTIPVIMLSGLEELENASRCIEMGAADYLTKPVDPNLLRARIRTSLG
jgi:CheY-like chemotaxis protein